MPSALRGLASPGSGGLEGLLFPNADVLDLTDIASSILNDTVAPFLGLLGVGQQAASGAADAVEEAGADGLGDALAAPFAARCQAGMGKAASIGRMSVPPSWTAPAATTGPLASALGGTPMIAPPAVADGMSGLAPMGNFAGHGYGRPVPQYGFRPAMVPRPPAAG